MKHFVRLTVVFAIALAAVACSKNSGAILSRVTTIATASDGKLLTDNGETFIINSGADGKDLSSGRWYIIADLVSKRGENTYEVNLQKILPVLVKNIRNDSTPLEPEVLVKDPIEAENIWISGGYVNMEILLLFISDSETVHLVNLVLDTGRSHADSLFFDIRHNAYGETPANPKYPSDKFLGGRSYASFPLSSLPSPITGETVFQFRFPWYDDLEKYTIKNYTITGTYTPSDKNQINQ